VVLLPARAVWWALVGTAALMGLAVVLTLSGMCRLVEAGGRVVAFVADPVDQWVTAWLGMPAVLPRLHRLRRLGLVVWQRWRDRRAGVVEAELMEGVVAMSRDRRLDELARVEFVGSLGEALGAYATALHKIAARWDTELGLASTDARKAMGSMKGRWLGLDTAARRVRARRVARRLRRAQTLVASVGKQARLLPREYQRQFLTSMEAGKAAISGSRDDRGGRR
jgi:hypothetical protein